ncbi:MAG TPA: FCD domain-containing protein [Microlunatus sp.]|nr:FCD domain-containing protein [Microlunatus sp.]
MTQVERRSLSHQVAALLRQYLDDEQFAAGDPIPPTRELAARFGVSVPVIREAIAELAGQGRLERAQGRATVTRLPSAADLEGLFRSRVGREADAVLQLHEFRRMLEVGAARSAAARATSADVAELRRRLATWRDHPEDSPEFLEADLSFHRAIAETARNDLVLMTMDAVAALLFDARVVGWRGWRNSGRTVEEIIAAHAAIVAAIEAGDPDQAERAMHRHLDQASLGLHAELDD